MFRIPSLKNVLARHYDVVVLQWWKNCEIAIDMNFMDYLDRTSHLFITSIARLQ